MGTGRHGVFSKTGFDMKRLTLILTMVATPLFAEWKPMTGAEIETALSGKTLIYDNAQQVFYPSGRTLYDAGRPSWGYWAARGDQYCSQWPPGDLWACYDMERDGDMLRFIAGDGSVTTGRYRE